jgi:TonB family protein
VAWLAWGGEVEQMSVTFMHEVLKISDRFNDPCNPDALGRQGQLRQVSLVVIVFHLIMGISFLKMEEYERAHPHRVANLDLSFQYVAPPLFPEPQIERVPKPPNLTLGENADAGSAPEANTRLNNKLAIPTLNQPKKILKQSEAPNHAKPNEQVPDAPVSVNTDPRLKPAPLSLPVTASNKVISDDPTNNTSKLASGANQKSGATGDDEAVGKGKGGAGVGGTGAGAGVIGSGSDDANIGAPHDISMNLNNIDRSLLNIAPYRKRLLLLLGSNWRPKIKGDLIVSFDLAKDGTVIRCSIFESSGHKSLDQQALAFVQEIQFEPLPENYQGDSLEFRVELANGKVH